MNGDEIDSLRHLRVLAPELPDVGVGHRNVDGVANAADHRGELARRLFAAQQNLVADDDGADGLGISAGELDDGRELPFVLLSLVADPGAQHRLHSQIAGDPRHLVEPLIDGVGADAAGHRRQMSEIVLDLLPGYHQVLVERRLAAPIGCVGDAWHARRWRVHHRHRPPLPPPERQCRQQREQIGDRRESAAQAHARRRKLGSGRHRGEYGHGLRPKATTQLHPSGGERADRAEL